MNERDLMRYISEPELGVNPPQTATLHAALTGLVPLVERDIAAARDPKIVQFHEVIAPEFRGILSQTVLDGTLFSREETIISLASSSLGKASYSITSRLFVAVPTDAGYYSAQDTNMLNELLSATYLIARTPEAIEKQMNRAFSIPARRLYVSSIAHFGMRIQLGHRNKEEELAKFQGLLHDAKAAGDTIYMADLQRRIQEVALNGNSSIWLDLCNDDFSDLTFEDLNRFKLQVGWYANAYRNVLEALYIAKGYLPPSDQIMMEVPKAFEKIDFQ